MLGCLLLSLVGSTDNHLIPIIAWMDESAVLAIVFWHLLTTAVKLSEQCLHLIGSWYCLAENFQGRSYNKGQALVVLTGPGGVDSTTHNVNFGQFCTWLWQERGVDTKSWVPTFQGEGIVIRLSLLQTIQLFKFISSLNLSVEITRNWQA